MQICWKSCFWAGKFSGHKEEGQEVTMGKEGRGRERKCAQRWWAGKRERETNMFGLYSKEPLWGRIDKSMDWKVQVWGQDMPVRD